MNPFHGTLNIKPDVPVVLTKIVAALMCAGRSYPFQTNYVLVIKLARRLGSRLESAGAGGDPRCMFSLHFPPLNEAGTLSYSQFNRLPRALWALWALWALFLEIGTVGWLDFAVTPISHTP